MDKPKIMGNLAERSLPELNELLERQNNLLRKRSFISNLPDKGERILHLKQQIVDEIHRRLAAEGPVAIDSLMHQTATESLEWTGTTACRAEQGDDDDSSDEKDPLKTFISHASAGNYRRLYRIDQPEKSLITPEDLIDDAPIEPYANRLCEMDETLPKTTKGSFKPHRTVIPHEQSPDKKPLPVHDWDENTAATPPNYIHSKAKIIRLEDSLDLLKVQAIRLKEIHEKQAADRLCRQIESLSMAEQETASMFATDTANEQEEMELAELQEDEEAEGGGVSYTIKDV